MNNLFYSLEDGKYYTYPDGDEATGIQIREVIEANERSISKLQQETEKLKKQYCERTDCGGRIGNSKKVEELQKENEQLKEKVKYQKNKIDNKDNWCQLIADIGFDYDGCNTIESLKGLIDELVRYALNSRDNYDYEEILKGDSLEEENKKYKNQQKEFIKWLEDYLNLFDYRDIDEQAGYDMLEEILQKYKEIIGK